MKYVCNNPSCPNYGQEEYLSSETYGFKDGRLVGKNANCPICGEERVEVQDPNSQLGPADKNISIMKFSMATPEGKREILKQRSHDHFEKEIRPQKEEKLRKTVQAFKEASKN